MKHGLDTTGKVTVKENRFCSKLGLRLVVRSGRSAVVAFAMCEVDLP